MVRGRDEAVNCFGGERRRWRKKRGGEKAKQGAGRGFHAPHRRLCFGGSCSSPIGDGKKDGMTEKAGPFFFIPCRYEANAAEDGQGEGVPDGLARWGEKSRAVGSS